MLQGTNQPNVIIILVQFCPLFCKGDHNLTASCKKTPTNQPKTNKTTKPSPPPQNDLTGPLPNCKIFSSVASISASQGLSSLLSAWHRLSQVFQPWVGGRKAVSFPSSLTEIKLKAFITDKFKQDNNCQQVVLPLIPAQPMEQIESRVQPVPH